MYKNTKPTEERELNDEDFSLLDLGVILARKKLIVIATTVLFVFAGLFLALTSDREYRSAMTVLSELGDGGPSGTLGSTLRSFGFALPSNSSGGTLSAQAIPDLVGSLQLRLAVARDSLFFPGTGRKATLVDYLQYRDSLQSRSLLGIASRWTVELPGRIISGLSGEPGEMLTSEAGGATSFLSEEDEAAARWLAQAVSASEDIDSGLITLTAVAWHPLVASQLVEKVAENLRLRVQEIFTIKTRRNLEFVEVQFVGAREELAVADQALAEFKDRNQSLTSWRAQLEEQRLQRDVSFKAQLYSEMQAQNTQAQIELQKSEPVITTIQAASASREPVGPNRKLTLIFALVSGLLAGVGVALTTWAIQNAASSGENREKLAEIRSAMPWPARRQQ